MSRLYYPQPGEPMPSAAAPVPTSSSQSGSGYPQPGEGPHYPQPGEGPHYPQPGEPVPPPQRPPQPPPAAQVPPQPAYTDQSELALEDEYQSHPGFAPAMQARPTPGGPGPQTQQTSLPGQNGQSGLQQDGQHPDFPSQVDFQSQSQGDFTPQLAHSQPFGSQTFGSQAAAAAAAAAAAGGPYATMPASPFAGMAPHSMSMPPYGAYGNPYSMPYGGAPAPAYPMPYPYPLRAYAPYAFNGMYGGAPGAAMGMGAGAGAAAGLGMARQMGGMEAHRLIRPKEIEQVLPAASDTAIDRDLSKLLHRAHRYGSEIGKSHYCSRKYAKYVFLCGMLLAKRGLPSVCVLDDPDDVYIKILNFYLANPLRLGPDAERTLVRALHAHHHHHHHHGHHHSHHSHHSHHRHHRQHRHRHSRRRGDKEDTEAADDGIVVQDERDEASMQKGGSRPRARHSRVSRSRDPTMSDESDWEA